MKLERIGLFILGLALCILSCKKDDGDEIIEIEIRDRGEQQQVDKDSILGFLDTHYYNSDDFVGNPNPSIIDLVITVLNTGESVPAGHTLLRDAVETHNTTFADTDYEFYILRLNQGGGAKSPAFADNIRVLYEGYTLDDDLNDLNDAFDSAVTPTEIDLIQTMQGVVGWTKVFPTFNTAANYMENNDGTVSYTNHGAGVMFVPSGLSYYQNATTGIPAYSPVIFKFDLLQMDENDHDGDGIPSYLEDLNGDGVFTVNPDDQDNDDDTDNNSFPNYFDIDDDGDGISTADEIKDLFEIKTYNEPTKSAIEALTFAANEVLVNIKEEADRTFTGTTITSTDTDGDGILDYLDAE